MGFGGGLSEVLSNPLVQATLAMHMANNAAGMYQQYEQGQQQDAINASLASGTPQTTMPGSLARHVGSWLTGGRMSPDATVDPRTQNLEKIAVTQQKAGVQQRQLEAWKTIASLRDAGADPKLLSTVAAQYGAPQGMFGGGGVNPADAVLAHQLNIDPSVLAGLPTKERENFLTQERGEQTHQDTEKDRSATRAETASRDRATESYRTQEQADRAEARSESAAARGDMPAPNPKDWVQNPVTKKWGYYTRGGNFAVMSDTKPIIESDTKPGKPMLKQVGNALMSYSYDAGSGTWKSAKVADIPAKVKDKNEFQTFAEGYLVDHQEAKGPEIVQAYDRQKAQAGAEGRITAEGSSTAMDVFRRKAKVSAEVKAENTDPAVEHKRQIDLIADADKVYKANSAEPYSVRHAAHLEWQKGRAKAILKSGGDLSLLGWKHGNSKSQGAGWLTSEGEFIPDAKEAPLKTKVVSDASAE